MPLIVLVAGTLLSLVAWKMIRQRMAEVVSAIGSYDWDRERWLAAAPARPTAERLFGDAKVSVELWYGGVAMWGERSPSGAIEHPQQGTWARDGDGLRIEVGDVRLQHGEVTEAALVFRAPEFGELVFARRPAAPR